MTRATVDLSCINVNYSCLSNGKTAYAVLKADAYGHGLPAVARSLFRTGCRRFAVATAAEALSLLSLCPGSEVLLLCPPDMRDIPPLLEAGAVFACGSLRFAEVLAAAARGGAPARIHIACNSGMNRMGFSLVGSDFMPTVALLLRLLRSPRLSVEGVCTHFAEGPTASRTRLQASRFSAAAKQLCLRRPELLLHASATPNLALPLDLPPGARTACRLGLALYGYGDMRVSPAMQLEAPVVETGLLHRGERIGYGESVPSSLPRETALVAAGYADGLPRLSAGAALLSPHGEAMPILGRVSMNLLSLDATASRVRAGDYVRILDFGGRCMQSLCQTSDRIPYELLLAGRQARRRYIQTK